MNKDAILEIAKKNVLSIICGVIIILSIVAIFFPIGGWIETLQTDATTQGNTYGTLQQMAVKPRKLPGIIVTDPTPPELTGFPTEANVKIAEAANKSVQVQADQMIEVVNSTNKIGHEELIPHVLPETAAQSQSLLFSWAKLYKQVLSSDPTATKATDPILQQGNALNLVNDVLMGGVPPDAKAILARQQTLFTSTFEPRIYTRNGTEVNRAEVMADFDVAKVLVPRQMKNEVAKNKKMYVDKIAFVANTLIPDTTAAAIEDVYYAQQELWMQRDIAAAIAEANLNAEDVLTAPVKRLLTLKIDQGIAMYVMPPPVASAQGGQSGPTFQPDKATDTMPLPKAYTVSRTGRVSNGMYDVLKFDMVLDVQVSEVNKFISTLSHNRLITVWSENMYALNLSDESDKGFLLGDSPVVRLRLEGEILYMRSWTKPLMPRGVQVQLGLLDATGAGNGNGNGPMNFNGGGGGGPKMIPSH